MSEKSSANRRCCRSPCAESSDGRSVATSISRSSRSRIAFAYSVRLRRCRTTAPGLMRTAALRSISVSSQSRSPSYSASAGRFEPRRRHHSCSQFPDNLFPDFRVIADRGQIQVFKRKIRGLQPIVMTRHAVLVEQRALLRARRRSRAGSLRVRHRCLSVAEYDGHDRDAAHNQRLVPHQSLHLAREVPAAPRLYRQRS